MCTFCRTHWLKCFVVLSAHFLVNCDAFSAETDEHPLKPPDTASPRATLSSFISALEDAFRIGSDPQSDGESYPVLMRAVRCLDTSQLPPDLAEDLGIEAALMLKEVFDRIELPTSDDIPDEGVLRQSPDNRAAIERWTIPNTDIAIGLIREGSRKGEFLFTSETVQRAPDFYALVRELPYNEKATPGIYVAYLTSPGRGLRVGWGESLPYWTKLLVWGQTIWQWLAGLLVLTLSAVFIRMLLTRGRRWDVNHGVEASGADRSDGHVWRVGVTLAVGVSAGLLLAAAWLMDGVIGFTGDPLTLVMRTLELAGVGFVCWLTGLVITQAGELLIRARQLRPRGAPGQLIRFATRLLALAVILSIVVYTAQRIGLPAYSVITGLGVGGLAVALAAQETLRDLLGSISIMANRPYRIGDWVVLGDKQGTVEAIGFRNTQVRTFYDSVLSIPNSNAASMTVDNMGMRNYRRVYTKFGIRYDTPPKRIEALLEGIKRIIQTNPTTRKDYFHVVLHDFGTASLDIMLYFFVKVPDWSAELVERQRVLLETIRLADALGVEFAFPTQTLQIETFPGRPTVPPDDHELSDERLRQIAERFGAGESARPEGLGIFVPPHKEKRH